MNNCINYAEIAIIKGNLPPELISIRIPVYCTVSNALDLANISAENFTLAIGGKIVDADAVLENGTRIDLVSDLKVTPEQARQLRKASKARKG